jgi:hypothetical protein
MTYFARVEPTGVSGIYDVVEVIRADQEFIDGQTGTWILTDYNTYGNQHFAPSPPAEPQTPDGGEPIRANYAGIGYTFDENYTVGLYVGVFYGPKPYPSWILNTSTFLWEAPVPYPTDGNLYIWDEATLSWVLAPNPPAPSAP